MVIQNVNKNYEVIRQLDGTEKMEEYLCREQQTGEYRLLVKVSDGTAAKHFTLFLEEKIKESQFADYLECFQQNMDLYAVFRYSFYPSLEEKLARENCSRKERAELARRLLEQILLRNPHPYFLKCALRADLITVSKSMEVSWNYQMTNEKSFDSCPLSFVFDQLSGIFARLFQTELSRKSYPLLEHYLEELQGGKFSAYLELYEKFMPVYTDLTEEGSEERAPQTFLFRLWERTKKLLGFLRKVLLVLLLAAAVCYVVYSCFLDTSGSEVVQQTIKQIGDVMIR